MPLSRAGGSLPDSVGSGEMVDSPTAMSYKCPGSNGGSAHLEENQSDPRISYQTDVRQQHNSALFEQKWLEIETHQPCNHSHSLPEPQPLMASVSCSYSGSPKCHSRRPIQECASGIRMDAGQSLFLLHPDNSAESTNRLICHGREPSVASIRLPECRPPSSGNRRSVSELEPVASDLPLPPSEPLIESARKTEDLQRESGPSGTNVAEKQLVSASAGTQTETLTPPSTETHSDSAATKCLRFLMDNRESTYLDFLLLAKKLCKGVERENALFQESYLLSSSMRQYNSSWKKWKAYVYKKEPKSIDLNFCTGFLKHLHDSGLAASIGTIKSQLTKPVLVAFGVDMSKDDFTNIRKACARLRTDPPPRKLSGHYLKC